MELMMAEGVERLNRSECPDVVSIEVSVQYLILVSGVGAGRSLLS